MFTGIIQARGKIESLEKGSQFVSIKISCNMDLSDTSVGDSIAVDGACLTASFVDSVNSGFTADVSPETLRVTTLGDLKVGSSVNLEKALRLDTRLGGHLVAGHVDTVGGLIEKKPYGPGFLLGFHVGATKYLIEKGSVAVDGVSLTVNSVGSNDFKVMIIPHTSGLTGLTEKQIGAKVNVEFDIIGKYIEKFVTSGKKESGVTQDKLKEYGFM